jgi:hypothetical protein
LSPELPQWESQTPRTSAQVAAQSLHIKRRIQRHQGSSPTSVLGSLDSLAKGVTLITHRASVMQVELDRLRAANTLLSKRKSRKRKVLKGVTSISVAEALQFNNQPVVTQNEASIEASLRRQRRCGRCRQPGHRIETCTQPQIDGSGPAE